MAKISNDVEFKKTLAALDVETQRALGCAFIEPLLGLTDDARIAHAIEAVRRRLGEDERAQALKSVKKAILDSHTRCGAEGDWNEQAGYFIARAAAACLAPEMPGKPSPLAWQAAMGCRMARMCQTIDSDEDRSAAQSAGQYAILEDFLKNTKNTKNTKKDPS